MPGRRSQARRVRSSRRTRCVKGLLWSAEHDCRLGRDVKFDRPAADDQPVETRFQQPPALGGALELGVYVTQPGDAAQRALDVDVPRAARRDLRVHCREVGVSGCALRLELTAHTRSFLFKRIKAVGYLRWSRLRTG